MYWCYGTSGYLLKFYCSIVFKQWEFTQDLTSQNSNNILLLQCSCPMGNLWNLSNVILRSLVCILTEVNLFIRLQSESDITAALLGTVNGIVCCLNVLDFISSYRLIKYYLTYTQIQYTVEWPPRDDHPLYATPNPFLLNKICLNQMTIW